jgi:hypothetical protein
MYTAENLGFDTICVNYDNGSQQDSICAGVNFGQVQAKVAQCFNDISQAKLDWTASSNGDDCTKPNQTACGNDSQPNKMGNNYYVLSPYDSIKYRISTMLYYLWCNGYDMANTSWENYLVLPQNATCQNTPVTDVAPKWSAIIMGGWSQGGDMSTFAATEQPIQRAINLSAPPQAVLVGSGDATDVMTPAAYFSYFLTHQTRLRNIYGFVSALDTAHYDPPNLGTNKQPSVYKAVWTAMGFDAERDLNPNCNPNTGSPKLCSSVSPPNPKPSIDCSANASHNLVTYSAQSVGGGHSDTPYIWHEDIFKFMLID